MSEILYGGFWRRLVAAILDQIILLLGRAFIYGVLTLIVYASLYLFEVKYYHVIIYSVFGFFIFVLNIWLTWIYFALMESSSLQGTLGKLALGVRVYHIENRPLTFEEATKRYFAKILSRYILLIGYILAAFSSKKQALHDFIANSVVLVER
ncbi:MAG TPA: RDD family protein [Turneriella sp.]|nr:RDD family protein [Turneriella sp.]